MRVDAIIDTAVCPGDFDQFVLALVIVGVQVALLPLQKGLPAKAWPTRSLRSTGGNLWPMSKNLLIKRWFLLRILLLKMALESKGVLKLGGNLDRRQKIGGR